MKIRLRRERPTGDGTSRRPVAAPRSIPWLSITLASYALVAAAIAAYL